MQAAKDAIKNITSKHGHHDTSVHERVAPAVTQETVTREQEDRVTTAVDREVHQDHYHTSVQPVLDKEVLPEKHHHKQAPIQERTFDHNNDSQTKERLAAEAAQFRDQSVRVEGQHTESQNPAVAGEHVHHHVHETIQPVVNKQTVEPHVVHHTIPVHEVHHNAAQHHSTSTLPAVGLDEFRTKGGVLEGRGERRDEFEGAPRNVGGASTGSSTTGSSGLTGSNTNDRTGLTGSNTNDRTGLNSSSTATGTGAGIGSTTSNTSSSTTGTKPSMMDKLNPKKDADGDGKAGIMN